MLRPAFRARARAGCLVAAAGLAAGALTACGSHPAASKAPAKKPRVTFQCENAAGGGPFFAPLEKGARDAAAAVGVDLDYASPAAGATTIQPTIQLMDTVISQKPDLLVVCDFVPSAQDPVIKRAIAAGIPVIIANSGYFTWRQTGALTYVGTDPVATGRETAAKLAAAGVTHPLCVDDVPENPSTLANCNGMKAAMPSTTILNLPAAQAYLHPAFTAQAVKGKLANDRTIDAIFTTSSGAGQGAKNALDVTGRSGSVKLWVNGFVQDTLTSIKKGDVLGATSEQPYLQGYLSVVYASMYVRYALQPSGAVLTGPAFVTAANVDAMLADVRSGVNSS